MKPEAHQGHAHGHDRLTNEPCAPVRFIDLFYFQNLIGLKDISFLDIVEVLDSYAAFESGLDFLDVILEPSEGTDLSVVDNTLSRRHPCPGVSFHTAVEHRTACNHSQFWNMKSLSYFRPANHILFVDWLEHADYGASDVIEELINDIIVSECPPIPARPVPATLVSERTLKPITIAFEAEASITSVSVTAPVPL